MKITVVGTGYVGLVAGVCLADSGNKIICVDKDKNKIDLLNNDKIPIYEPGLLDIFLKNKREGRLTFTTDLALSVSKTDIIFIAVGTPPGEDGSADLSHVLSVAEYIGKNINGYKIIVDKSTVPVGTGDRVEETIKKYTDEEFDVVSNPEFLKEGSALTDFLKPDRVIIGTKSERARKIMNELYEPFVRTGNPIINMDLKSAEMTKYVANSILATRISFMNEMANLCEVLGANIDEVRKGISTDTRIGPSFLFPGVGYGGSCFPKDVQALIKTGDQHGYKLKILPAVEQVNETQKVILLDKILRYYNNDIKDKTFTIWGLAFKPKTDDIREAPSRALIDKLLEYNVKIKVFDSVAIDNIEAVYKENLIYSKDMYEAVDDSDGLIIMTEWNAFRRPDYMEIYNRMNTKVIFDGRNIYKPYKVRSYNFDYFSVGRE